MYEFQKKFDSNLTEQPQLDRQSSELFPTNNLHKHIHKLPSLKRTAFKSIHFHSRLASKGSPTPIKQTITKREIVCVHHRNRHLILPALHRLGCGNGKEKGPGDVRRRHLGAVGEEATGSGVGQAFDRCDPLAHICAQQGRKSRNDEEFFVVVLFIRGAC
ncbi:hypothetical protein AVEN_200251-1 [Araneus ventricosus]|uniref:Uncharacterized protein n=1 Tax=Araneus ventricosus TaxID=182803 RepID=A0A4Y2DUF4_ARAVE|nr:hypothetical protein AVEN_200251-1 [Araneus ventricosus]